MILENTPEGILSDNDAAWMASNLSTVPPDKKLLAESKLHEYKVFRAQHPSPAMVERDATNESAVLGLYEAPDKADFGPLYPTLPEAEKGNVRTRVANEYFLSHTTKNGREMYSDPMAYAAERGRVAGQLFEGRGADSDTAFATEAKTYLGKRRDFKIQALSFSQAGAAAALKLNPEDGLKEAAKMKESAASIDGASLEDSDKFFAAFQEARAAMETLAGPYRPQAKLISGLLKIGAGQDSGGSDLSLGVDPNQKALDIMAEIPPDAREAVIRMIQSEPGKSEAGTAGKQAASYWRGLAGQLRGFGSNIRRDGLLGMQQQLAAGTLQIPVGMSVEDGFQTLMGDKPQNMDASRATRPATEEETKQLKAMAEKELQRNVLAGDIANILESTIDPLKPSGYAERIALNTIRSLGAMTPMVIPWAGVAVAQGGYADEEFRRQLSLGTPVAAAHQVSQITGAVQAGVERVAFLFNFAPESLVAKLAPKITSAPYSTSFAAQIAAKMGTIQAAEYGEEMVQDATPIFTATLAQKFGWELPEAAQVGAEVERWKQAGGLWKPETFMTVLALSMFGGGVHGIKNTLEARNELIAQAGDSTKLEAIGIAPAEAARIAALPEAERLSAYQNAYKDRNPSTPEAAAAQQRISEGIIAENTAFSAAMQDSGVTMERSVTPEGAPVYRVTRGDTVTEHASAPTALAAVQEHMGQADREANGPLLQMLAELDANPLSPVQQGSVTIGQGETVADFQARRAAVMQDTNATPQERLRAERESAAMADRQKVYEAQNPDKPVDWRAVSVGGQSELEVKDGVAKAVIKVASGQSAYTALEEKTEAEASAWVQSQGTTWTNLESMIREVEKATGDTYINGHTAGVDAGQDQLAVKEAYSELAQVHATGKGLSSKKKMSGITETARLDRQTARTNLIQAIAKGEIAAELVARLKAHVEWLKTVVGKAIRLNRARREAGGEFAIDQFLNKSLGIKEDVKHAAEVVKEAQKIFPDSTTEDVGFNLKAMDADYMAAVESGDTVKQQEMVDAAASNNGYTTLYYHGGPTGITEFSRSSGARARRGGGIYLATQAEGPAGGPINAASFATKGGKVYKLYSKLRNPVEMNENVPESKVEEWTNAQRAKGHDGVLSYRWMHNGKAINQEILANAVRERGGSEQDIQEVLAVLEDKNTVTVWGYEHVKDMMGTELADSIFEKRLDQVVVFDPNQIKSADPITRDESGNVIPLSQRFDSTKDSISFRLTPIETLDKLAAQMAKQTRDPDARRKVYEQMLAAFGTLRRNWTESREVFNGKTRPKSEKRSVKELDKEQAFREAVAYEDAEATVMNSLTSSAQAALGMTGEDVSAFGGTLAKRFTGGRFGTSGRIKGKMAALRDADSGHIALGALYDGVEGIPPMFFGGSITADNAAQEAYEAGEISEPTPDALWAAISSELQTQAGNKEAMKSALSTLKAAQKAAKESAKAQAAAWREEQDAIQSEDWDPRAVMLRHLRTLDAILSALPPEVRAKVGGWTAVASLKTQEAMQKELANRLEKADIHLEAYLKADALAAIGKILDKARPSREKGQKSKGKLGAAVHRFFDEVERVAALTPKQVEAEQVALEAELVADGVTELEQADIFEKQQALDMFGALGKQVTHDAAHLTTALDMLEQVYVEGRNRWRMLEEARLAEVAAYAGEVVNTLGAPSYSGSQKQRAKSSALIGKLSKWSLDVKSFPEIMTELLGQGNPLAKRWSRMAREAYAKKNDDTRALRNRWRDALEKATGKKGVEARRILWDMGSDQNQKIKVTKAGEGGETTTQVPISLIDSWAIGEGDPKASGVSAEDAKDLIEKRTAMKEEDMRESLPLKQVKRGPVETVPLNEAQGVFLTMLAAQEQYSAGLDRAGWDAAAIASIEEQLSPAAKSLRSFMANEYREGYAPLAKVFERMFGVGLPQIKNYAPASLYHAGNEVTMDVSGSGTVEGGFRQGFLKNRKPHQAAPKLENAFATFFGHANQTAHWKAMAETVREMSGVFNKPEVKRAIEAAHGKEMLGALSQWMKALEGNGIQVQSGIIDGVVRWLTTQQAYIALSWKVGTLFKQSSALLGSAYKMPTTEYLKGFAKLMTGQLDGKAMFNSPVIQRRLETGFAPEVRAAMNDIWTSKPSKRMAFLERGMEMIGLVDAIFTTGSAAIAYDYHLKQAQKAGLAGPAAEAAAMQEVDDIVGATAQPADAPDRSLFELRQGAFGKLIFLFASEARQKSALWLNAWQNTLTGKATKADARVLILSHLIIAPMMQVIGSAVRDARNDDDDELFDSNNWDPMDFLKSAAVTPLSGVPILGQLTSGFTDSGVAGRFVMAGKSLQQVMEGAGAKEDEPVEWYFKRITRIMQGLDAFTGTVGSVAGQVFDFGDDLIMDAKEAAAAKKRRETKTKKELREAAKEAAGG